MILDITDREHYDGGTPDEPSLLIRNASRDDLGAYHCTVQNLIGESTSNTKSYVNILYKPTVRLTMDPDEPVREQDQQNVMLSCDVISGNPSVLDSVRWYLDGIILKELPECPPGLTSSGNATSGLSSAFGKNDLDGEDDEEGEDEVVSFNELCDIDPSKLMLQAVGRGFEGNYTCQAHNSAGWGRMSESSKLHVHCKWI